MQAGLRGDNGAVANRRDGPELADWPAKMQLSPTTVEPGESDLAAEQGVFADFRGVADEDQVVKLGAAADARLADGGAVDAGVGLDFDVVFQDGGAGLQHFVPAAVRLLGEAKAIRADDDAVLQDDAVAEFGSVREDHGTCEWAKK